MSESLQPKRDSGLTRREFLAGAAAAAGSASEAKAGLLDWILGREAKELGDEFHAAREYMQQEGGALAKNFAKLQALGKDVAKGVYSAPNGKKMLDANIAPILAERNELLRRFDATLVPQLLAQYAEGGVQKSLTRVYAELGGDLAAVKAKGVSAVDLKLAERIASEMRYHIQTNESQPGLGETTYSPLSFVRRREEPSAMTAQPE